MNLNGIHNVLSINRFTLPSTQKEAKTATAAPQVEHQNIFIDAKNLPVLNDEYIDSQQEYMVEDDVDNRQKDKRTR